jgi:replicative DNA helicase
MKYGIAEELMSDPSLERLMPEAVDVEKLILGYIMETGSMDEELDAEDFYVDAHRNLWRLFQDMTTQGLKPDLISVIEALRSNGNLNACGGVAYIASLSDGIPHYKEGLSYQYTQILREKYALRKGIQIGTDLIASCYQNDPFIKTVDRSFSDLDGIFTKLDRRSGPKHVGEIIDDTYHEIERIAERNEGDGIKTGFRGIDSIISAGIRRKNLAVVAGRPGHGKTSMLTGILRRASKSGHAGILFSLEMDEREIIMRLLSDIANVDSVKMHNGLLKRDDWTRLQAAAAELSEFPIWIDDSTGLTVSDVRSRIRRLRKPIEMVMIDYLQLLSPPQDMLRSNETDKIASISKGIKFMAKSMDIAVVAASQLNRSPERRRDRRPQLSDLRQSGQIEQDCDIAILLYREEVGDPSEENLGVAEVIIGKQRNGPIGSVAMSFAKEFSSFQDLWKEGPIRDF